MASAHAAHDSISLCANRIQILPWSSSFSYFLFEFCKSMESHETRQRCFISSEPLHSLGKIWTTLQNARTRPSRERREKNLEIPKQTILRQLGNLLTFQGNRCTTKKLFGKPCFCLIEMRQKGGSVKGRFWWMCLYPLFRTKIHPPHVILPVLRGKRTFWQMCPYPCFRGKGNTC